MPGPVPKRSDERRRRNKPEIETDAASASGVRTWPEPHEHWHPLAADWFRSLGESGQRAFYEPSDVAAASYVAEAMSRSLADPDRIPASLFSAVITAAGELLTTEGARRRLRIELAKPDDADPAETRAVAHLADARARMEKRTG